MYISVQVFLLRSVPFLCVEIKNLTVPFAFLFRIELQILIKHRRESYNYVAVCHDNWRNNHRILYDNSIERPVHYTAAVSCPIVTKQKQPVHLLAHILIRNCPVLHSGSLLSVPHLRPSDIQFGAERSNEFRLEGPSLLITLVNNGQRREREEKAHHRYL